MELVERFVRRHAQRITVGGATMLSTNGDPLLVDAFQALGWTDPRPDEGPSAPEVAVERRAPEQAIESHPGER